MFATKRIPPMERRAIRDRAWLIEFFLGLDELSDRASRILKDRSVLNLQPELTDLADKAAEFREALDALEAAPFLPAPAPPQEAANV